MNPKILSARFSLLVSLLIVMVIPLLGGWSGVSLGQGQPRARQLRQLEPINTLPDKAKRWALVIGVDKYRDQQIGSLKGSENDARTLADALVRNGGFPPDQVIVLATDQPEERQPTRVNILRRLSNLASVAPKDGLLLISFAGHGMERNGQAFLLPSDAQISEDVAFLEETALSVARMKDRIRASGVKQVIILLDACRNDPGGRAEAPNPLSAAYLAAFNFDLKNTDIQAFATLYATAVGQRAYEYSERRQGYFTWAVVEGLKGAAANEKGEITLAGLVDYVQNAVPKRIGIDLGAAKQQRPFAVIEGYKADQLVVAVSGPPGSATTTPAATAPVDSSAVEMSFWETIKNSNEPSDFHAYLDRFPNGTFAALARTRAKRNVVASPADATSSPSLPAVAGNVDEMLDQAQRDLQDKDYNKALSMGRGILASNPEHAKANLLVGLTYLQIKKYSNSVNHLSKALALGEQIDIPIQHQHDVFMVGDGLCSGFLRLSKKSFEFHSTSASKDDFVVSPGKVYEMVVDPGGGGRIRMKVGIDKGGKEDKRNLAFHPSNAYVGKKAGSSLTWIFCDGCLADAQSLSQLLQQLIKASSATQEISVSGSLPNGVQTDADKQRDPANPANNEEHAKLLRELLDCEKKVLDAFLKGDKAAMAALMADEFTQVQDKKTYNKSQILAEVKAGRTPMTLSYETVEATLEGDSGVLEGVAVLRAQNANAMVTVRQKFKDVFVKRNGQWLAIKSQVTTLK